MTDLPPIPSDAIQDPPFSDDDLDAALQVLFLPETVEDAVIDDLDVERAPFVAWVPTDERGAEWAMRKLAEAQAEIDRHQLHLQGWVEEMQDWYARATRDAERRRRTMEAKLVAYALRVREEEGRATVPLPSGIVKTTKTGGTAKVEDPAAVEAFLREYLTDPEVLESVLPTQPPKVAAREFGKLTRVVERHEEIDRCETCRVWRDESECVCPLGPTWKVEPRIERIVVLADTGHPVPGTSVAPEGYSPKVNPGAVR